MTLLLSYDLSVQQSDFCRFIGVQAYFADRTVQPLGDFFVYLPYTLLIAACAVLHGFHLVNQRTEQFASVGFQLDNHIGEYPVYDILTHMAVLTFGRTGRAAGAYPMCLAVYHLMSEGSAAFGTAQLSGQRIGLSFASFRFP